MESIWAWLKNYCIPTIARSTVDKLHKRTRELCANAHATSEAVLFRAWLTSQLLLEKPLARQA